MLPAGARDPASRAGEPAERVFQRTYRGDPAVLAEVRHHVAVALAGVPAADDAVWCLHEIAANAIVHSRSGQPGGSFTVAADVVAGALVAIVVTDQGGPWAEHEADTYRHGLAAIRQIATEVRIDGDDNGRAVWAILPWEQDMTPAPDEAVPRPVTESFPPGVDPVVRDKVDETWPLHSSLKLGVLPTAAGCAEAHAKLVAIEWGLGPLSDAAGRVAAEMIARAARESGELEHRPPAWLWLRTDRKRVLVAVWDAVPDPPECPTEPSGSFGPEVTEERGWHKQAGGKTCWSVLAWNEARLSANAGHPAMMP